MVRQLSLFPGSSNTVPLAGLPLTEMSEFDNPGSRKHWFSFKKTVCFKRPGHQI